jgi:hypothetical protein
MRGIGCEQGQQIEVLPDLDELALADVACTPTSRRS